MAKRNFVNKIVKRFRIWDVVVLGFIGYYLYQRAQEGAIIDTVATIIFWLYAFSWVYRFLKPRTSV